MKCPLCKQATAGVIYEAGQTPLFQNKVYPDQAAARAATRGTVRLAGCTDCGYVWNCAFEPGLMDYDADYQNEQAHSPTFDRYLEQVADLLDARGFRERKSVEIGCGKGTFLHKLWQRGFDACGFDTAYEGSDPRVRKQYFDATHADPDIALIVLRHTLEHITDPLTFVQQLAGYCGPATQIYIEVPSFEWICRKQAFWDVFHEHCNYFTADSLGGMFDCAEQGFLFGGQYMYVLADLLSVRANAQKRRGAAANVSQSLQQELDRYRRFVQQHAGLLVWGAGAKGSTFVNLTDPACQLIHAVIDINAKKAGGYIAGSGHPILAPDAIAGTGASEVLVMNELYLEEILAQLDTLGLRDLKLFTLGLD